MADGLVIRTEVVGADALAAGMAADATKIAIFTRGNTLRYGQHLLTAVQAAASGRPGPRSQTGDYRRSITLSTGQATGTISATVGTNSPQGRRLEYGFAPGIAPQGGVDVRGRQFHQPPLPHFGPAFDRISRLYRESMTRGVAKIVSEHTAPPAGS